MVEGNKNKAEDFETAKIHMIFYFKHSNRTSSLETPVVSLHRLVCFIYNYRDRVVRDFKAVKKSRTNSAIRGLQTLELCSRDSVICNFRDFPS